MTKSHRKICYYVSGHGLGHASRAIQVMQEFGSEIELTIKSSAPESFFARELKRKFHLVPQAWDTGADQKNNLEIDWDKTFARAEQTHRECSKNLDVETTWLRDEAFDLVVTDVPPPPLLAAQHARLPSVCVANFTWVEIFAQAASHNGAREELLTAYRHQYATASLLLRPQFQFEMPYFPVAHNVPLIARKGTDVRAAIVDALAIPAGSRIVLLYFGNWGEGELDFQQLQKAPNVTFVSLHPMPSPIRCLDATTYPFQDVVASVDAVLAKPGYGTMGECMANGTPVVYYPRPEFSEYFMIRKQLQQWGGAVEIGLRDFMSCNWGHALEHAFALSPERVESNGAAIAAAEMIKLLENQT